MKSIISSDQTAYVPGRYIGESIRLVEDMLEFSDQNNLEGILFAIDFEKAFDSVEHPFIFATLKKFGFGPDFIRWVSTLFYDAQSCVMNNGYTTGYFPLKRGTRQGDPLSAYLFIIVLEVLLIQVRQNHEIKGINIEDIEIKLSAYADDSYFFIKDSMSANKLLKLCSQFEVYSSLKINLGKSEACWIGASKYKQPGAVDCKWVDLTKESIRALGTFQSYDLKLKDKLNFLELSSIVKDSLKPWRGLGISIAGRIQVFKSLALSKAIFVSTMLHDNQKFIEDLSAIQKDFIWEGKPRKIKHSTLIGDYSKGGLRDIDITTKVKSLKFMWVKKLSDNNFHSWKIIASKYFDKVGGAESMHNNFQLSGCLKNSFLSLPLFYRNLLEVWTEFANFEPATFQEVRSQYLWNNRFIVTQSNSLYNPSMITKNIVRVDDIFQPDGSALTFKDAQRKFNLRNSQFLQWFGLIKAIPPKWKDLLKSQDPTQDFSLLPLDSVKIEDARVVVLQKIHAKTVYSSLLKKCLGRPTSQSLVSRLISIDISDDALWKQIYLLPRKVSVESSLRVFQYKILNNILYLNKHLYKMKKVESPLCSQCQLVEETIAHFFCECHKTKQIWFAIQSWLKDAIQLPNLSYRLAVIGDPQLQAEKLVLVNHIILLFKRFLYERRNCQSRVVLASFRLYLAEVQQIEHKIALRRKHLPAHFSKWDPIIGLLSD